MSLAEILCRVFFALLIFGLIYLAGLWFNAPFWPMYAIYIGFIIVNTIEDLAIRDVREFAARRKALKDNGMI